MMSSTFTILSLLSVMSWPCKAQNSTLLLLKSLLHMHLLRYTGCAGLADH